MKRAAYVMAFAACAPLQVTQPADVPTTGCKLGPVVAAQPGRVVTSYPIKLDLDDAARTQRTRALEAKAPGWHITVDRTGFPEELAYRLELPIGHSSTPAHDALVTTLFANLREDLALGPHAKALPNGDGSWTVQTDTPEDRFVQIWARQTLEPPQIHVKVAHGIPLPAGFSLIPIADLMKQWGTPPTAQIELARFEDGHPCDPVHSVHDCDGAGPRMTVECEPLLPVPPWLGALQHNVVPTPLGYRWVVYLYLQHGPCSGPTCKLTTHVPRCTDAITGETLAAELCAIPE